MARRLVLGALGVLGVWLAYEIWAFPRVGTLTHANPGSTAWMELREREARASGRRVRRAQVWVPLAAISPELRKAVLVAEDAAFFRHEGIDYDELREALKASLDRLELGRGASTITQQLAKNLYLSPSRNPVRKLRELILTRALERALSKNRIFELYLNVIEWGDGIYGAEAASRVYFGKSSAHLTSREAAALAAVIINPRRYSPTHPNLRIWNRIELIQTRMQRYRYDP